MVGISRVRVRRERPVVGGFIRRISDNSITQVSYPYAPYERTEDVHGNPKGNNPFYNLKLYAASVPVVTGKLNNIKADGYTPSCVGSFSFGRYDSLEKFRDPVGAISDSHPGNPTVSLPNFLYELKDIPHMWKHLKVRALQLENAARGHGRAQVQHYLRTRGSADDWLNYNFGWRPFYQDMADMIPIFLNMDKRTKTLKQLAKKGKISRRSGLGSHRFGSTDPNGIFDVNLSWYGQRMEEYTSERWCVSNWVIDPLRFDASVADSQRKLLAASLGVWDFSVTQLWNAVPWTWLTDWFTGAGDVINIHQNKMGIRFNGACTMTYRKWKATITPRPRGDFSSGPGIICQEEKTRSLTDVSFDRKTSEPYFSPGQLVTLASLSASRTPR